MEGALTHTVDVGSIPTDVVFHPSNEERIVACGTIDGSLQVYRYGDEKDSFSSLVSTSLRSSEASKDRCSVDVDSCRGIAFAQGGDVICAAYSADHGIRVTDLGSGGKIIRTISHAHDSCIHRCLSVDGMLWTGDDEGCVKVWDMRAGGDKAVASLEPHTDYVSDMVAHDDALLTVSGDGTLCMIDRNVFKVRHRSEDDADDELLSVCVIRQGRKVVCGTTSGVLNIYSWGYWNDCSDRFPGHPDSVTGMVAFDEETVLTGSSDGLIRVLSIQPNKMLGVLGEHSDFDIERMALKGDAMCLASISHDSSLKLWNTGLLLDDDDDDDDDNKVDKEEEERSDSDSDDSDDGARGKGKRTADEGRRNKGAHKIPKKESQKEPVSNFFADLL
ncbi:hypothetical protein M9434_001409 [Picochlorum sp. BPE23]|nr:hypothetical protein M9434_001409 [Picochlorum sp. BPE23]